MYFPILTLFFATALAGPIFGRNKSPPVHHTSPKHIPISKSDITILNSFNEMIYKYGVAPRKWNQELADQAYEVVSHNKGGLTMDLVMPRLSYPGFQAQLLFPGRNDSNPSTGTFTAFQLAIFNWLCGKENDVQLGGRCPDAFKHSLVTASNPNTHDLVINKVYTEVGCAFAAKPSVNSTGTPWQGLWACNLASSKPS